MRRQPGMDPTLAAKTKTRRGWGTRCGGWRGEENIDGDPHLSTSSYRHHRSPNARDRWHPRQEREKLPRPWSPGEGEIEAQQGLKPDVPLVGCCGPAEAVPLLQSPVPTEFCRGLYRRKIHRGGRREWPPASSRILWEPGVGVNPPKVVVGSGAKGVGGVLDIIVVGI